jgi:hypothetical protein
MSLVICSMREIGSRASRFARSRKSSRVTFFVRFVLVLVRLAAPEWAQAILDILRVKRAARLPQRGFVEIEAVLDRDARRGLVYLTSLRDLGFEGIENAMRFGAGFGEAGRASRPLHGLPAFRLRVDPLGTGTAGFGRVAEFATVNMASGVNDDRAVDGVELGLLRRLGFLHDDESFPGQSCGWQAVDGFSCELWPSAD